MANVEYLQKELVRTTDWIKFSDQKSAFLSAYYTAAAGLAIANRSRLMEFFTSGMNEKICIELIVLVSGIVCFVAGLFHLLYSVLPRLKRNSTTQSLVYFGDIANLSLDEYKKKMEESDEVEMANQILEQLHTNSKIALQKMNAVKAATMCLIGLVMTIIIMAFLI